DPQTRLESLGVNLVREPAVSVRELLIGVPIASRLLVAVVELDVAEEAAVEGGGTELQVRDDVRLAHVTEQLIPGAPPRGRGRGCRASSRARRGSRAPPRPSPGPPACGRRSRSDSH